MKMGQKYVFKGNFGITFLTILLQQCQKRSNTNTNKGVVGKISPQTCRDAHLKLNILNILSILNIPFRNFKNNNINILEFGMQ